ncbi:MAG: tetratricopeptide repeat protein [bacterium]|nr:tetratricopeptide repeat protein [bacterium]
MFAKSKNLLFVILVLVMVSGAGTAFAANPVRVGCIPFENITGSKDVDWISEGIPKAIALELAKNPGLKILESDEIKRTLSELGLPVGSSVNSSNAQKVGQKIGSEFIIIGNFQQFGSEIKIDAHITSVATGVIVDSQKVTGKVDNVFALQDSLVEAVSNSMKKIVSAQSTAPKAPAPIPVPTATAAPASTPPPPPPLSPPPPLTKSAAKSKKSTENEATRALISKQQKKGSASFSQAENDATRQLLAQQQAGAPETTGAAPAAAVPVAVTPSPAPPAPPKTVSRSQEDQATKELMQEKKAATNASEWYNKGVRLNNNSDEEMAYYREAIRSDPTFAPPYYNLGLILYNRGMRQEATENFEKYVIYSKDAAEKARVQEILQKINSNQPAAPSEPKVNTPEKGPDKMPILYEDKGPGIRQP